MKIVSGKNPKSLKIMFMGDSITSGFADTNTALMAGYRGPLMKTLASSLGFTPQYVGSNNTNSAANGWCGNSGLTISEINDGIYAPVQVAQYGPDVIFLHIGTNDTTQRHSTTNPTLSVSRSNLTGLLNTIRYGAPKCLVILARIIDNQNAGQEVIEFNESAIDIDSKRRIDYGDGRLKIFDMYSYLGAYNTTNWASADPTHPSTTGYAIMAAGWQSAFDLYF